MPSDCYRLNAVSLDLVTDVKKFLLDRSAEPCPDLPNPPQTKKRASVALIIRIRPHHSCWPPLQDPMNRTGAVDNVSQQLQAFFDQEWVKQGDPEVLFIKRAERKGDRWTSHVALPGGRRDAEDKDDVSTAIRETQEEVGLVLSGANSIAAGNLPQRVVKTSWGLVPLMVLCPYIFVLTRHDIPPLRLQPSEVSSAHWVSLRALIAPSQRTYEYQDISNRLARGRGDFWRAFLGAVLGKMVFGAIRLIPSESLYCSSLPGFVPERSSASIGTGGLDIGLLARWRKAPAPAASMDKPLLLWGLTLVIQHKSSESCWVILYGKVYDVTDFLPHHPGGVNAILRVAGSDATEQYDPIHPPGTLEENLKPEALVGDIDTATLPPPDKPIGSGNDGANSEDQDPDLDSLLNLDDIEDAATKKIDYKTWAYYFSAADDLYTKALNSAGYRSILLRPRIFVDVTRCNTSTTLLGHDVNLPIYVAPAAMARLAHRDGEHGIARACATYGALQIISNNASQAPEQIVANAKPGQIFGWQLYVQIERRRSEVMLTRISKLPAVKFVCLTLDAPTPGKREHDERAKNIASRLPIVSAVQEGSATHTTPNPATGSIDGLESGKGSAKAAVKGKSSKSADGIANQLFQGMAPDLTWRTTLPWLARTTSLPIVLKGIQTHEDAYLASLCAPQVRAIILSNHGGRALDTAPPPIHTLLEIRKYCPEVFNRVEVWVDGGIRRGTDVVKALCLGARAVGIGRAALFGLGAGGKEGVERVLEILKAETETCMRLLGVELIDQLGTMHVNPRSVERDLYDGPAGIDTISDLDELKSKL